MKVSFDVFGHLHQGASISYTIRYTNKEVHYEKLCSQPGNN